MSLGSLGVVPPAGWLPRQGRLVFSSVPLDRTAQGGTRAKVSTRFRLIDPLEPSRSRLVAELDGGGWFGGDINRLWLRSEGERTRGVTEHAELQALCPTAMILLVDGEMFSWYGSRMREAARLT